MREFGFKRIRSLFKLIIVSFVAQQYKICLCIIAGFICDSVRELFGILVRVAE